MKNSFIILGSGITGLSAGISTGSLVYEAKDIAGGICASYYADLEGKKYFYRNNDESYRFEVGGGHWIFGADEKIMNFFNLLKVEIQKYERKSAVYFPDLDLYVAYPLQNNLYSLPEHIRNKALEEILDNKDRTKDVSTLADWLEVNFGKTLCELFFFPFHDLYTAGLYTQIAPQDKFKTPINIDLIIKGAKGKILGIGYNAVFAYPKNGLNDLIKSMSDKCAVNFGKKVIKIDLRERNVYFNDGSFVKYKQAISTLPLNKIVDMADLDVGKANPYTSVLVVNIGAQKGDRCPNYHWVYVPRSKTGFHRVGFYSNVDNSFLPASSRAAGDRISIYVEKAFIGNNKPDNSTIQQICNEIVEELKEWRYIAKEEVVDPTWIEIAYTWQYPCSDWKDKAIKMLEGNHIYQVGRYGKWKFQGIADSIKDGLEIKKNLGY